MGRPRLVVLLSIALAVKVPLGTWCLVMLAVGVTIVDIARKRQSSRPTALPQAGEEIGFSAPWRDEMLLLVPGLASLIIVSSQTGFSVHSRYILPALPLFLVWSSKSGRVFEMRPMTKTRRALTAVVVVAMTGSVGSSLWVYPHSLSYFNQLVGGPRRGGEHLLGSNIDWGQDLYYLKKWLDKRPEVRFDGLAYYNSYPATLGGIPETPFPPSGPRGEEDYLHLTNKQFGPKPGRCAR